MFFCFLTRADILSISYATSSRDVRTSRSEAAVRDGAQQSQLFFGFYAGRAFGENAAAFVIYDLPAIAAGAATHGIWHIII